MIRTSVILTMMAAAAPLFAQSVTGVAAVDSAAVARAAWSRAVVAQRNRAPGVVLAEITRAERAWPTQPSYPWARAVYAARANDTGAAMAALRDYADLGLGRDIGGDSTFAALRGVQGFAELRARHDRNRASVVSGTVLCEFGDTLLWPEGVGYDARTGDFYVGSVRQRTVVRVSPSGDVHDLLPRNAPGTGSVLGVRVDAPRHVVWAVTSGLKQMQGYIPSDSAIGALLRIDRASGRITHRWTIPVVPGGHVLGDLALGDNGDVWFTDSNEPVLYRLRKGADTLERFTNPLFHNLQGMAPTADGRFVYVADYSHGLLRVEVRSHRVIRLADAPHSTSLGVDGIVLFQNAIIGVQNGVSPARIVRFDLDPAGGAIASVRVLDQNPALVPEPTIGTIVGDHFVYVANSLWDEFDDDGRRIPGKPLSRPRLVSVPIFPR